MRFICVQAVKVTDEMFFDSLDPPTVVTEGATKYDVGNVMRDVNVERLPPLVPLTVEASVRFPELSRDMIDAPEA